MPLQEFNFIVSNVNKKVLRILCYRLVQVHQPICRDSSLMFSLYSRSVPSKELAALSSNLSSSRFRDWLDIFSGFLSQTSSWNNTSNLLKNSLLQKRHVFWEFMITSQYSSQVWNELLCYSASFIANVDILTRQKPALEWTPTSLVPFLNPTDQTPD